MHPFVIYDKTTGEITGFFRISSTDYVPTPSLPEEAFVQVTDETQLANLETIDPSRQVPRGRVKEGKLEAFEIRHRFRGRIVLTTDLPDLDGDGIPELPADGRATARIKVQVLDEVGNELRDNLPEVKLQTTRGTISRRMLQLTDGTAEVELRAAGETTSVRITARAKDFDSMALHLEVIPTEEYQELKGRK